MSDKTDILDYVLQSDLNNRLTPRVIDIAYTAFTAAKATNAEDGGPSDWFNDTKPKVDRLIAKLRDELLSAPDSEALKRERYLSRDLMDLLKSMFDAPTMAAGYAILADFSGQFWPNKPVALRDAAAADLTETARNHAVVALTEDQFEALEALSGYLGSEGRGDGAVALGEHALVSVGELRQIASIAEQLPEFPAFDGAAYLSAARAVAPAGVPEVDGQLRYFAHDASGGVTDFFATEAEAIAFAKEGVKVASEAANDDGEWEEGADQIYVGTVTHRAFLQEREGGTYDLTFGLLSAAPTAQGQDADDTIKKRWIIIREPGNVPVTKIPKQSHDGAREFLRECAAIYPAADITLAELAWNNDLWVSDGREALTIDDAMAEYADEADDWKAGNGDENDEDDRPSAPASTAPVPVTSAEPVPVRCSSCGWLGDATELGEEGECGGDESCAGRPAEITDQADMLKAWQDSEGQICGKALADAGLIEPKPANNEEAFWMDLKVGDTVWHVSHAGKALLEARQSSAFTSTEEARASGLLIGTAPVETKESSHG